ncbi:MAG: hypothetical protein ACRCVA_14990 [Phreatobacter sp.]
MSWNTGTAMAVVLTAGTLVGTPALAACRFNTTVIVQGPPATRLPAGSRLALTIFDGNLADAPMSMTAVAAISRPVAGRRFPIVVPIRVRSDKRCPIQPSLSAQIKVGERLVFFNDTRTEARPGGRSPIQVKPLAY